MFGEEKRVREREKKREKKRRNFISALHTSGWICTHVILEVFVIIIIIITFIVVIVSLGECH